MNRDQIIEAWLRGEITRESMEAQIIAPLRSGTQGAPATELSDSTEPVEYSRPAPGRMRSERRQAVWDITGGRCFYCACQLTSDGDALFETTGSYVGRPGAPLMEEDHKIARKKGGGDELSNRVPACNRCNVRKGAKSLEDFRIYLMLLTGRAPDPFFGENPAPAKRDWLVVASLRLPKPHEPYEERIAVYREDGAR